MKKKIQRIKEKELLPMISIILLAIGIILWGYAIFPYGMVDNLVNLIIFAIVGLILFIIGKFVLK